MNMTAAVCQEKASDALGAQLVGLEKGQGTVVRSIDKETALLMTGEERNGDILFKAPVELSTSAWDTASGVA